MTTRRVRLVCYTVVLFLLSALPAFATGVRMVRLSLVQGDVQIDRNSGVGWEQAIVNMPVLSGARIYAAENSKAELEFEDGSDVRLVGPAQISLTNLSSKPDGSPVNAIQVDSGEIYVNARLLDHEDFRISDYSGESFAITKPSHLRFSVNDQTASLAVSDGEVVAQNASSNGTIRSGETYNYILGQPESSVRLEKVLPQQEDSWNQQRDTYNDQNAAAGAQYSGEDQYAPGEADLGYYGNYSEVPGYGEVWQPNDVGPDWSPFDNGAWSYYPDWGWTFVSAYPWGWAPFYYGNWFYITGYGWCWHPGHEHGFGGHGHGEHGFGGHGHGSGLGFHPRPQVAGATPHGFSAPHPPTGSARTTVAVAGSHLRVGPIDNTHASAMASGFAHAGVASGSRSAGSTPVPASLRSGPPSELRAGATSGAVRTPSNQHGPYITGQRGSYTVHGFSGGRSGFEAHRPPTSYTAHSYAPRAYPYSGSYAPHSYSYAGSYAPRFYNPAPVERAPSVPSFGYAPHISSGVGGAVSHSSGFGGGGFHGGGGGGFHGGGGGGFHGGGGGGHR